MTAAITYEEYEAARQASATPTGGPTFAPRIDQKAWVEVLQSTCAGSAGVVVFVHDYGPLLPHVGTSSFIVDRRGVKGSLTRRLTEPSAGFRKVVALSVIEQMRELLAALSLNKSQLAKILRVTRPTMYDWFQGKEPNTANAGRLQALLRTLARASVSGASPLNARFVRQPMDLDAPSLIDLLCEDALDEERVVRAIAQARTLGDSASQRRTAREDRLRALGFEDPSSEQRKEQLARNIALQDWPK